MGYETNRPVQNDPKLFMPTKIRSTAGNFCVAGKPVPAGEEVYVEPHVAESLIALKKAEFA